MYFPEFRVWDDYKNEMRDCGFYIGSCGVVYEKDYSDMVGMPGWKLMMDIGMKDIQNKKIFDGDIVRIKRTTINPKTKEKIPYNVVAKVSYIPECGCFGYLPQGSNIWQDFRYKKAEGFIIEVIGDIYRNPELFD